MDERNGKKLVEKNTYIFETLFAECIQFIFFLVQCLNRLFIVEKM